PPPPPPPPVMFLVMHSVYLVMISADFLARSGSGFSSFAPAFFAISVPHLVISSLTLSLQALSLQSHIFFWNSSIFARASPPLPLQPKERAMAPTHAIVNLFIG